MKTAGKKFEEDFLNSFKDEILIIRLKDPGASFNLECTECDKNKTRFSPRNICDFIAFNGQNLLFFELKSHLGKSVPIKAIITSKRDKRLAQMAEHQERWESVFSYVIFNWRDIDNKTLMVPVYEVISFIETTDRKSIPFGFTLEKGQELYSKKKRVRYKYSFNKEDL